MVNVSNRSDDLTLAAPIRPVDLLDRARLHDRYDRAVGKMVRIIAPGGYGKTHLASRWALTEGRPLRWVDLDRSSDDPASLLTTLHRALDGIADLPATCDFSAAETDDAPPSLPGWLAEPLARCTTPFVLVLDDIHFLTGRSTAALVADLATHLPSSSTLVVIGRAHHHHETLGRLRLTPGVVDLTANDLAFDLGEAEELLWSIGLTITSDETSELMKHLDGWPAGLHLAGQVLLEGRREAASVSEIVVDHPNLVDYLRAEWMGTIDEADRRLLEVAACTERLTGDFADGVLGRSDSVTALRRLQHDRSLVLPIDSRDAWFRLHPLLAHWLESELRTTDAARWRDVQRAAARFWESQGNIDRAVEHAHRCGDHEHAEALVVEHGGHYVTKGLVASVRRWLEGFPAEFRIASPDLCVIGAVESLHAGDGRRARHWQALFDQGRALADAVDDVAEDTSVTRWRISVFEAALDERTARELIPTAERARAHLENAPWMAFADWVLGALRFMAGDGEAAVSTIEEGAFEAQLVEATIMHANCLATAAIVADLEEVDPELVTHHAGTAIRLLHDHHHEFSKTTAPVHAIQALLAARCGRSGDASRSMEIARGHLAGFTTIAPWFNVITRLALVRTALLIDDRAASRTLMNELEHHVRFDRTGRGADVHVRALRAQVDATRQTAVGPWSLTSAELRVLRRLHTNLSLADIANELFVSRNTVKSHTAAIYRKLGVTSRRDAVDTARSAGVLGDDTSDRRT